MGSLDREVFLRVLKGAPLSVLLALWVFGPMDRKAIMARTGWKKGSVDDALDFLEGLGLVVRPHYRQWALADGFYQLPLPLAEVPKNGLSESYPQLAEVPKNGTSENYPQVESPKNGTSDAEVPKNGLSAHSSSGSRSTTKNEVSPLLPCPQILKACTEVGIFGKKRTLLATMSHVVEGGPDFVRAHVKHAATIELAIYRLEHNWSLPKAKNGHAQEIPEELKDVIRR